MALGWFDRTSTARASPQYILHVPLFFKLKRRRRGKRCVCEGSLFVSGGISSRSAALSSPTPLLFFPFLLLLLLFRFRFFFPSTISSPPSPNFRVSCARARQRWAFIDSTRCYIRPPLRRTVSSSLSLLLLWCRRLLAGSKQPVRAKPISLVTQPTADNIHIYR